MDQQIKVITVVWRGRHGGGNVGKAIRQKSETVTNPKLSPTRKVNHGDFRFRFGEGFKSYTRLINAIADIAVFD